VSAAGRRDASGRGACGRAVTRLLAAAASALLLAGCGGHSGPSIVLYNGQHPELTSALVAAFEKATGITVEIRANDSVVLADQLLQ
jgi:iron(III) transport system substrate-binding protein